MCFAQLPLAIHVPALPLPVTGLIYYVLRSLHLALAILASPLPLSQHAPSFVQPTPLPCTCP